MSGRIFQGVVLQLRNSVEFPLGVMDNEGNVVACSELSMIGKRWPTAAEAALETPDKAVTWETMTLRALVGGVGSEFIVFVNGGKTQSALMACNMAAVALENAKIYYEEKHDKSAFVKSVLSDNILLGDIYARAREFQFPTEACRAVLVIRQPGHTENGVLEILQSLFTDREGDFVLSMNDTDIAVVRQLGSESTEREIRQIAGRIQETLAEKLPASPAIGIGTVATSLRELAKSYKEGEVAIEVGRVFEPNQTIVSYENLGIGRLIYQLPTTLCEMFLQEVFKKNPIDNLEEETLYTIQKFFENNLNVSETARKLFVHRNTLVYRLEKIKKLTGLDLRGFDDAITFKVALMVKEYLISRGLYA